MPQDDFIMTIDSDAEVDGSEPLPQSSKSSKKQKGQPDALNPEFTFDVSGDPYFDLLDQQASGVQDLIKTGSKAEPISVDDIIARRKLKMTAKRKREDDDEEGGSDGEEEDESEEDSAEGEEEEEEEEEEEFGGLTVSDREEDQDEEDDPLATTDEEEESDAEDLSGADEISDASSSDSEEETEADKQRKAAFFDSEISAKDNAHSSFLTMNLSRPILKAITSLGFSKPTPIQAATIPVALLGKDIVGNAVTGSGKTAAFIIPMLERLLYREKGAKAAASRCLILVPTRELAVQCYDVGVKLAAHTDIRFALTVGGLSLSSQEATLRTRPDIIIATPGRLIDHIRNSHSFTLDALDILVLDEADRMLSEGFADELTEIVKSCPVSRQTMLFSATMTDSVDELVRMSLQRPVRLFVDPKRSTAKGLVQEFVRVRAGKEGERSAMLVTMCKRTFKSGVIIFLRSKKLAHQLRIVFGLLDMKCEELHGDLTQEQRLRSLQAFRDGTVDYLMATDLASRGLDIKGIETVINYDMPSQLAQYLHRVGRTARAGKKGRSVTLVGEADRKMLKAAIKRSPNEDQIQHRILPAEQLAKWVAKLEEMKDEVSAILTEEKEERELRKAERELKKGENILEHKDEIFSRPARTWFQSGKEKEKAQALSKKAYESGFNDEATSKSSKKQTEVDPNKPKRDKFSGLSRKAKRRKLAAEEDAEIGGTGAINASIRSAKKSARPKPIGEPEPRKAAKTKSKEKKAKAKAQRVTGKKAGWSFDKDAGQKGTKGKVMEGTRARKGDAIGGMSKKPKAKGASVKKKRK